MIELRFYALNNWEDSVIVWRDNSQCAVLQEIWIGLYYLDLNLLKTLIKQWRNSACLLALILQTMFHHYIRLGAQILFPILLCLLHLSLCLGKGAICSIQVSYCSPVSLGHVDSPAYVQWGWRCKLLFWIYLYNPSSRAYICWSWHVLGLTINIGGGEVRTQFRYC